MLIPFLPDNLTVELCLWVLFLYWIDRTRNGFMEWFPGA